MTDRTTNQPTNRRTDRFIGTLTLQYYQHIHTVYQCISNIYHKIWICENVKIMYISTYLCIKKIFEFMCIHIKHIFVYIFYMPYTVGLSHKQTFIFATNSARCTLCRTVVGFFNWNEILSVYSVFGKYCSLTIFTHFF